MDILLFSTVWHEQALARQLAWGVAAVSTVLLFIFATLSIFGKPEPEARAKDPVSVRLVLPFAAFSAWGWVVASYQHISLFATIAIAVATGLAGIGISRLLMRFLSYFFNRENFDLQCADQSTGKALKTIPPHRNGFGAVHLNVRQAPFAIEAVTSGKAITPGTPVRVVGVIDEKVVLVEPIEEKDGPASPLT